MTQKSPAPLSFLYRDARPFFSRGTTLFHTPVRVLLVVPVTAGSRPFLLGSPDPLGRLLKGQFTTFTQPPFTGRRLSDAFPWLLLPVTVFTLSLNLTHLSFSVNSQGKRKFVPSARCTGFSPGLPSPARPKRRWRFPQPLPWQRRGNNRFSPAIRPEIRPP